MKQFNYSSQNVSQRRLDMLLAPSWLSALVAITVGLVIVIGVWLIFGLHDIADQQQITKWQSDSIQSVLTLPGRPIAENSTNSLQNTWPLLAFWGVVGLIVYIIVQTIFRFFGHVAELQQELSYVNVSRNKLRSDIIKQLLFKVAVAAIWLLYCNLFFKAIVPYAITAAHASASDILSLAGLLAALLAFVVTVLSIHLHVILVRLIVGRPRVFSVN